MRQKLDEKQTPAQEAAGQQRKRGGEPSWGFVKVYWVLVVVVFFALSLLTGRWDRTFFLFPIAALLYVLIDHFFRRQDS